MRTLFLIVVIGLSAAITLPAMQTSPAAAFEVASVRRNTSVNGRTLMDGSGGRYTVTNAPLRALVRIAYALQEEQLVGPGWIDSARFDILASRGGAPIDQVPAMLRTLLAERFKLEAHIESREMPMYALVTVRAGGKLGTKMVPATDCETRTDPLPGGFARSGNRMSCQTQLVGPGRLRAGGLRIGDLAPLLSPIVGRIVIDQTKLAGRYDIELSWTPELRRGPSGELVPNTEPGVSVFTALQEQLGLKLTGERAPVDVLVIDHIEQPAEN